MADLLKLSKEYHSHIVARLKTSGLSPAQLKVHERILELAQQASDVNDLEQKKNAENLTFALSRAIAIDTWQAKAKAAAESEDSLATKIFTETAQAAARTTDHQSLASAIDRSSTEGMARLREQEDTRTVFIEAVSAVFDYRAVHPANIEKKKKVAGDLRIQVAKLSAKGMTFTDLAANPLYRASLPLNDAQWRQVLATHEEMQSPSADPEAKLKLDQEVAEARELLKDKSDRMKEITRYLEEKGTRMAWLGIAPEEKPGPYAFEKIWEGGRDE